MGRIVVHKFITLDGVIDNPARALLADGLVDELHLFVYPLALGGGPRLFENGVKAKFTLAASETYDNGALHLTYQPAG